MQVAGMGFSASVDPRFAQWTVACIEVMRNRSTKVCVRNEKSSACNLHAIYHGVSNICDSRGCFAAKVSCMEKI